MHPSTLEVPASLDGKFLDGTIRALWPELSWARARKLIQTGKICLGKTTVTDLHHRVRGGDVVSIVMNAPKATSSLPEQSQLLVHVDAHVVVVRKPAGINTVPFAAKEQDTLDQVVRRVLNKQKHVRGGPHQASLGVVHRLDRDTTGLLVFARTLAAKKHLAAQFRAHSVRRRYEALAHGHLTAQTFRSHLVANRGDGLRGSTRLSQTGSYAVTHVDVVAAYADATHISCRLETGRTHQIRIHLSEAGHPLVGEKVYVRRFNGPLLPAPRIMLHAIELGFIHPHTQQEMSWQEPLPDDFQQVRQNLVRLRLRGVRLGSATPVQVPATLATHELQYPFG